MVFRMVGISVKRKGSAVQRIHSHPVSQEKSKRVLGNQDKGSSLKIMRKRRFVLVSQNSLRFSL
jgi:hypothetical protein